ncbi:MAG: hypothetical protein Terrestrivirus2_14 [Terrestrivirus sp.]|uniref:UDP-glucose 6-dehydrogenase n=1 Tax=Terrestrivirus sp. TaxID=2487775 RepID=A0A3G4ZKZ5_9VIRU|nr:MAG: hypothetical protein Terrestrivirus2_14 [Terrestrivirus sp.]
MKIAIIGGGFVGVATASLKSENIDVIIYDIDRKKCSPPDIQLDDLLKDDVDIIFICLPTPYNPINGVCITSIIEDFIKSLIQFDNNITNKIVIRSTIPPTLCDKYNVAHMPEFLTESNPIGTFKATNLWVIGINDNDELKNKLVTLLNYAYTNGVINSNKIQFCNTKESSLIKLARNSFLAMKVSFFNEIYDIVEGYGVDYETVRYGISGDLRIGDSHSKVPGPDGYFGWGGICLGKDLNSGIITAENVGVDPIILKAIRERNKKDRPIDAEKIDHVIGRSVLTEINKNQ